MAFPAIIETATNTLITGGEKSIIPNTVTTIGNYAFVGTRYMSSMIIPESVTNIGKEAFRYCPELKSITIGENVETIGESCFVSCGYLDEINIADLSTWCRIDMGRYPFNNSYYLKQNGTVIRDMVIPNDITEVKQYAFYYCNGLTSVTIPKHVIRIGLSAFGNCKDLSEVICKSITPVTAEDNSIFYNVPTTTTLYVPKDSKNAYANATGWNTIGNITEYVVEAEEYIITYIVDGKVYHSEAIEYGKEIPAINTPIKEGYTFSGWGDMPLNMPDKNLVVYATFTPNNYTVTFKANGEVRSSESIAYGTTIVAPDAPEVEDYAFVEWANLLETVPAYDVEFSAVYKQVGMTIVDGKTSFDQDEDVSFSKITYTRTFNNTEWNALYVPFEIPVSQLIEDYEVAYINGIHSYDDDENGEIDRMSMEVVKVKSGTLHANHPYLIKARTEEAKQMSITVNNTTLYAAESTTLDCSSVYTKYEITGIYEQMTGSELMGCYALSGGTWKTIASNSYLTPFRLYLRITSRGNLPVKVSPLAMTRINIHVKGGEGSTSIEELMMQEQPVEEVIYDLMGRRVENPVKGHIYIVNGKKRVY